MNTATLRALMAKRVAGIPVMVIVALFAGVILFFAIRMRSSTGDTTDASSDNTPAEDAGPTDDTQQPDFSAVPGDGLTATPVVTQTATNDTNDAWKRRTITWLMGNGYSVSVATTAITKYLNGEKLTVEEGKARDAAITQFGLPPEDIPDSPPISSGAGKGSSNAPASKQGEPPLNHTVMGNRDNNPSELAVLYYGTNNADAVNKIRAANNTKVAPYAVGTKVHIPENYVPHYFTATAHIHTLYDIARRNGVDPSKVESLNPDKKFPVKPGTRVRVK